MRGGYAQSSWSPGVITACDADSPNLSLSTVGPLLVHCRIGASRGPARLRLAPQRSWPGAWPTRHVLLWTRMFRSAFDRTPPIDIYRWCGRITAVPTITQAAGLSSLRWFGRYRRLARYGRLVSHLVRLRNSGGAGSAALEGRVRPHRHGFAQQLREAIQVHPKEFR